MPAIRFQSIQVSNFGPFTEPQTWQIDGNPGLIYVTGTNEVEPELAANGVGKTKLFDALTYACCGRTGDGARGPDLRNWDTAQQASIELRLMLGRQPVRITRTIGPNGLQLDYQGETREVEQTEVDRLIGLSLPAFRACVHHGQGTDSFIDLGPTDQLELLSELLNLDVYTQASDEASAAVKQLVQEINEMRVEIGYRRGKLVELENQISELETKEHHYARQRMRFLLQFDAELSGWRKQLEVCQRKRDVASYEISILPFDVIKDKAARAKNLLHDLTIEGSELARLRTRRAQLATALKEARACPTCGRTFDNYRLAEQHASKELDKIDSEIKIRDKEVERLREQHKLADREMLDLSRETQVKEDSLRVQLREAEKNLTGCEAEIKAIRGRRTELLNEDNPYAADLAARQERLSALKSKQDRAAMQLAALTARETHYSYWIKAFKDLRLSVAETALLQLTVETNSLLQHFGLPDWQLLATGEGLTKTGTVRRGMALSVAMGGHERPIGRVSGGERQRLRLAVALGISNLIRSVTGIHFNVELFDEPTTWLSGRGVELLLAALNDRALHQGKRIFLADHRSHSWPFSASMLLTKTEWGTTIQQL